MQGLLRGRVGVIKRTCRGSSTCWMMPRRERRTPRTRGDHSLLVSWGSERPVALRRTSTKRFRITQVRRASASHHPLLGFCDVPSSFLAGAVSHSPPRYLLSCSSSPVSGLHRPYPRCLFYVLKEFGCWNPVHCCPTWWRPRLRSQWTLFEDSRFSLPLRPSSNSSMYGVWHLPRKTLLF